MLYEHQCKNNAAYREFCDLLGKPMPSSLQDIPYLPIEFFKSRDIRTDRSAAPQRVFESSGTTQFNARSKHFVTDLSIYETSFQRAFDQFFGNPKQFVILALLPGYEERGTSSLLYMVQHLIEESGHSSSGFYLNRYREVAERAWEIHETEARIPLIFGVSFALLDLADQKIGLPPKSIIVETGGMKGRRREITRDELHQSIRQGTGVREVRSEYGMTELLSQAYSDAHGNFHTPNWMKLLIRDPEDPLSPMTDGRTGGINAIDLANMHSCAFLATQDLGRKNPDGTIQILGRFDYSDVRGCNLIVD